MESEDLHQIGLVHLVEIDSTNNYLKEAILAGRLSIAAVSADRQTAGRGRMKRHWQSPEGGIYLSVSFPLKDLEITPIFASVIVGVALAEYLHDELNVPARLKWPNDVFVDGKKLCGMLSEYVVNDTVGPHVIVGVGLNINRQIVTSDSLYNATSLKEETGVTYDLGTLRKDIIDAIFERWSKTSKKCDRRKLVGVWQYYSETIGADVEILVEDERIVGRAIGLTDDFELILETGQGRKTISVGDCRTLRRSVKKKREQEV